jgi:hypothetical protein
MLLARNGDNRGRVTSRKNYLTYGERTAMSSIRS